MFVIVYYCYYYCYHQQHRHPVLMSASHSNSIVTINNYSAIYTPQYRTVAPSPFSQFDSHLAKYKLVTAVSPDFSFPTVFRGELVETML
ncbi:unnamed protein product [Gongylonema pulchrum]|uniref:Ovule protein n=1 Tax=Gongylonema pulchrum TaxID=637853 RepID=A0A183CXU4_9BILA|nr:unnamed protein product [Gongylonema pulchrum]